MSHDFRESPSMRIFLRAKFRFSVIFLTSYITGNKNSFLPTKVPHARLKLLYVSILHPLGSSIENSSNHKRNNSGEYSNDYASA